MLKLNLAESSETGKRLNLERPAAQKPFGSATFGAPGHLRPPVVLPSNRKVPNCRYFFPCR
jgi:hypothetical protein